jgi:hypothetical protein
VLGWSGALPVIPVEESAGLGLDLGKILTFETREVSLSNERSNDLSGTISLSPPPSFENGSSTSHRSRATGPPRQREPMRNGRADLGRNYPGGTVQDLQQEAQDLQQRTHNKVRNSPSAKRT